MWDDDPGDNGGDKRGEGRQILDTDTRRVAGG